MSLKIQPYTSSALFKHYSLIDTPGIVDSKAIFTPDMEDALVEFSKIATHILVFFEPNNYLLCNRLITICRSIINNTTHKSQNGTRSEDSTFDDISHKFHFILNKGDTFDDTSSLQAVLQQMSHQIARLNSSEEAPNEKDKQRQRVLNPNNNNIYVISVRMSEQNKNNSGKKVSSHNSSTEEHTHPTHLPPSDINQMDALIKVCYLILSIFCALIHILPVDYSSFLSSSTSNVPLSLAHSLLFPIDFF